MPSYFETETERQKIGDKTVNIALPILAAIEAIATAKASRGANVGTNTLTLWKDIQGRRESALDRALGRDKDAADLTRDNTLLGFQKETNERAKNEFSAKENQAAKAEKLRQNTINKLLGKPAETDPTGKEISPAIPGVEGLSDLDKAAIEADPIGWLENKLKPQSMQFLMGENGFFQVPKAGGTAEAITTKDGGVVKPRPAPTGVFKTPEQIEAEAAAKARGTAAGSSAGLTKGQAAFDTEFAKNNVEFVTGGAADAQKNLDQLKGIRDQLSTPGSNATGPVRGRLPDFVQSIVTPEALDMREQVEEVVQRNLRLVLGAQFTQAEGERLIKRAYNPNLPPATNAARLDRLITQMDAAYKAKVEAADYFNEHGTLKGFDTSRLVRSAADFDLGDGSGAAPKPKAPGVVLTDALQNPTAGAPTAPVPEGTEKINAQGAKVRMTGGKWRVVQ